jgi:integrase
MRNDPQNSATGAVRERRTLKVCEWPKADRIAWEAACKRSNRLKKGGSASYLKPESQEEYARRYGLFLGFLKQKGLLDLSAPTAAHVNPENIQRYLDDLAPRVRSVTVWNSVSMVRRVARFIAPSRDFSWLREIDNDLAFVMQPKSKMERVVYAERLVEGGLKLIDKAQQFRQTDFKRARAIRNGLMLALWPLCGSRRKNFASLEIGKTFKMVRGQWWISIAAKQTKSGRQPEERPIARWMNPYISLYLNEARPVLLTGARQETNALWISSESRARITPTSLTALITQLTQQTVGIALSPHLFRTADATTIAEAKGDMPHLASALLGHTHPRITEEHYNRASSLSVTNEYQQILQQNYGPAKA